MAATPPEVAARLLESWGIIDVTDTLQHVEAPTLVTHARGDARVPFEQGRVIAAGIPGSRFIELESRNHILFGLRQVWLQLIGKPYTPIGFRTPGPYRLVRHPLYVGWLFAFWSTPTMSVTHLLFAVATTGYILVAIQLEERDLLASLGDAYREYRQRVPMLLPFAKRRVTPDTQEISGVT